MSRLKVSAVLSRMHPFPSTATPCTPFWDRIHGCPTIRGCCTKPPPLCAGFSLNLCTMSSELYPCHPCMSLSFISEPLLGAGIISDWMYASTVDSKNIQGTQSLTETHSCTDVSLVMPNLFQPLLLGQGHRKPLGGGVWVACQAGWQAGAGQWCRDGAAAALPVLSHSRRTLLQIPQFPTELLERYQEH